MALHRYTLYRVNPFPLAKFGCTLGGVAMALPGLVCAVGATQLIGILRQLLETWQSSEVDPLGLGMPAEFNFIALLGLEAAQALVIRLDDQRALVWLLIFAGSIVGGGIFIAGMLLLLGWIYNLLANLTGGVEVELKAPPGR
jgi:hypothetical protein